MRKISIYPHLILNLLCLLMIVHHAVHDNCCSEVPFLGLFGQNLWFIWVFVFKTLFLLSFVLMIELNIHPPLDLPGVFCVSVVDW